MSSNPKVYVAGVGMITPVGANAEMTAAMVRAGISQYQASGFYNKDDKPMTTASVPDDALPPLNEELLWIGLTGREKRLLQIATPALQDLTATYPLKEPVPLFLAGPESLPDGAKPVTGKIIGHLKTQTGIDIDLASSRYFATGRAGALEAIELAFKYFSATTGSYVLVGGVDSYLDAAVLSKLDVENRVLAENINNGFAPGEAAAFLLLTKSRPNIKSTVALFEPGLGVETGHRYSDAPYQGQGLADALSMAISNGGGQKISTIFSSMNGENFSAKEFGVATVRNQSSLTENYEHIHPAESFGDIGAATGIVSIALAWRNIEKNKLQDQQLVYCSSDQENRAAICVSRV